MITNLENKLKFIELIDEMKNIKRTITLKNGNQENDAEHSFHLALIVMIFLENFQYLDQLKCIKIALLHDLVEIFAGDTFIFDKEGLSTKKQREFESINKLEKILGNTSFKEFRQIIEEYEERKTKESLFVFQLDKLHPIIQIYMSKGVDFHKQKVTREMVEENKYSKIDSTFGFDKILKQYFNKLEEENLFYI